MSPQDGIPDTSQESFGNFDLVKRHKLSFSDILVSKWRSRVSGLNVIHLDYEAPIVHGYFVVPTEIFNDSGCPHTLEHLIFLGSEKYPYKGVLDNLANRAFSEGTNAWTGTDHTCYTIETAGQEGFLQLLPIFVEHILYPTLTKHGFVTEVHHINPKGGDSGVVYSEMQARENTSSDLMALRMSRLVNHSESAYRSETGGLTAALRSLTVEEIRDYHRTYYAPYNLSLIIAGKVSAPALFDILQDQVERSIATHPHSRPTQWKRPFVETVTAQRVSLTETRRETIKFPEKDESTGELLMTFAGSAPHDYLTAKALDVLGSYLTTSPVAPLNKEFIEIAKPLCTDISIYESTRVSFSDLNISVEDIPTEHLENFDVLLREALRRVADDGIDMQRMKTVIEWEKRGFYSEVESSQGDYFINVMIHEFLYGQEDGESLPAAMSDDLDFTQLAKWSEREWVHLLRKYFISPSYAVVYGKPSTQLADLLESDEKSRIDEQITRLGQEGLATAAKELETAQAHNDRPIPQDLLTCFPVPNVESITWIPVQSVQHPGSKGQKTTLVVGNESEDLARHVTQDTSDLPFFIQFDHVKSDFVTVSAFLSSAKLPDPLRLYMPLYLASFFSLPITQQSTGCKLTYEEVTNGLRTDTVSYAANLGLDGRFTQLVVIGIKVEVTKYDKAVSWLSDLMLRSEFDIKRLEVTAAKYKQSLPAAKRRGEIMVSGLSGALLYGPSSTGQAEDVFSQVEFIPGLMEKLRTTPDEVIADMLELRQHLTSSSGLRFVVTGNVIGLHEPKAAWSKAFNSLSTNELQPVPLSCDTLNSLGYSPCKKAVVLTMASIESAYTIHSTSAIRGFDHPEYPALRVALEVLNATEGFFWRCIRGAGLAYHPSILMDPEAGLLQFLAWKATNPYEAFQEARKVVQQLSDGTVTFDETTLDSCKSSMVYQVTASISTPDTAALLSFTNQVLKGVPQNHTSHLLKKFQAVTIQDVIRAIRIHVLPLFDSERSVVAVATSPSKANDVAQGLESAGFEVERRELSTDVWADESDGSESGSSDGNDDDGGGDGDGDGDGDDESR